MKIKISPFLFALLIIIFSSCEINPFDVLSSKEQKNTIYNYENVKEKDKENSIGSEINAPDINERKWNILIYMSADNNLETAALDDIYEMETSSLNTEEVSVFMLVDRSKGYSASNGNWSGTRLFKLQTGRNKHNKTMISKEIPCRELGLYEGSNVDLDMSDNNVLSDILSYLQERYPANNYGLVLWGHGAGWRSNTYENNYKGFAYDDTNKSYMTLRQLRLGLESGLKNQKLNFIGFDTCFGGELEVMYELRDLCNVAVGSEGLMEIYGWNYNEVFNNFCREKNKTASVFARNIVDSFSKNYKTSINASIVSVNMNEIENYFVAFNEVMKNIASAIDNKDVRDTIINKLFYDKKSNIRKFAYNEFEKDNDLYLDINELVKNLALCFSGNIEIEKSINKYYTIKNNCFINSWASFEDEGGLGVFFATMAPGNTIKGLYPAAYIKDKVPYQIDFVRDSNGYVPTINNSGSFLDKLFY